MLRFAMNQMLTGDYPVSHNAPLIDLKLMHLNIMPIPHTNLYDVPQIICLMERSIHDES